MSEVEQRQQETPFDNWWRNEGSGLRPLPEEDAEAHVHRVCQLAWERGYLAAVFST